jgi:hypothetical protein
VAAGQRHNVVLEDFIFERFDERVLLRRIESNAEDAERSARHVGTGERLPAVPQRLMFSPHLRQGRAGGRFVHARSSRKNLCARGSAVTSFGFANEGRPTVEGHRARLP